MLLAAAVLFFTLLFILHAGIVFSRKNENSHPVILFFLALMGISANLSWISIWWAINQSMLFSFLGILAIATVVRFTVVRQKYKNLLFQASSNKLVLLFGGLLFFLFTYALTAEITLFDTGLYHTQAIKWIKEYAVVPGLGNIHGRFAFNSHFFVASALFTFEWSRAGESILIYPLNAAALFVFLVWIFHLVQKTFAVKNFTKAVTYAVMLGFCLFLYPAWLNAPSPDIIAAVFVLLAFVYSWEVKTWQPRNILILSSIILTAIVIKLSSIFLCLLLIPAFFSFLKKSSSLSPPSPIWREGWGVRSVLIAIFILTPFFIRNYYLSGYLVYPSTAINLFSPDWQIPADIVQAENLHISTWAKVPREADAVVSNMTMQEWIPLWWQRKSMPFKILVGGCLLSLVSLGYFIKQKKYTEISLLAVLWANLLFWFFTAPDPRFVHGFLIFGFAIAFAPFFGTVFHRLSSLQTFNPKLSTAAFLVLVFAAAFTVRENPKHMFTQNLLYPIAIASNPLTYYEKPFPHAVPQTDQRCYNAALPCLPTTNYFVYKKMWDTRKGYKFAKKIDGSGN